jgi:hypothetical protein
VNKAALALIVLLLAGCAGGDDIIFVPPPGIPQSAVATELEGCRDDARLIYDEVEREQNVNNCMSSRGFGVRHVAK